jgi:hypothetical protein
MVRARVRILLVLKHDVDPNFHSNFIINSNCDSNPTFVLDFNLNFIAIFNSNCNSNYNPNP